MALTNMTKADSVDLDNGFVDVITFDGDAAYPTGGYDFKALFKTAVGRDSEPLSVFGYGGDNTVEYLPASGKLKMRAAGGAEVGSGTNLSAVSFRVTVISR